MLLTIACGDGKKEKLAVLYAKRTAIEKLIDSVKKVRIEYVKKRPEGTLDFTIERELISASNEITRLGNEIKKIDFSIDSLSKY
jgi:hypothetical protein